jgi:hypothetical protein
VRDVPLLVLTRNSSARRRATAVAMPTARMCPPLPTELPRGRIAMRRGAAVVPAAACNFLRAWATMCLQPPCVPGEGECWNCWRRADVATCARPPSTRVGHARCAARALANQAAAHASTCGVCLGHTAKWCLWGLPLRRTAAAHHGTAAHPLGRSPGSGGGASSGVGCRAATATPRQCTRQRTSTEPACRPSRWELVTD